MKPAIAVLAAVLALPALGAPPKEDLLTQARKSFKVLPARAPAAKDNATYPAKVELGRMLFFEPRLSASQLISCNTCHNLSLGGGDMQETSVGHGWQKGPRNAPTVLNAVFNVAQFWDGRAEDLKAQAKGPVQASVEMNNKPARVVETLKSIPGYLPHFARAFPGEQDPVTFDNMARAIEAFEATLLTPDAPLDRYLRGDRKALAAGQQQGLALFMAKGCDACHGGVNLGGDAYYQFGVVEAPTAEQRPPGDTGRFKVTSSDADRYSFRSPSLRNVALTPPYFHSGKVWTLQEAVKVMGADQLGVALTADEAERITEFLRGLTGTQPRVEYPLLPAGSDATPRPDLRVDAG